MSFNIQPQNSGDRFIPLQNSYSFTTHSLVKEFHKSKENCSAYERAIAEVCLPLIKGNGRFMHYNDRLQRESQHEEGRRLRMFGTSQNTIEKKSFTFPNKPEQTFEVVDNEGLGQDIYFTVMDLLKDTLAIIIEKDICIKHLVNKDIYAFNTNKKQYYSFGIKSVEPNTVAWHTDHTLLVGGVEKSSEVILGLLDIEASSYLKLKSPDTFFKPITICTVSRDVFLVGGKDGYLFRMDRRENKVSQLKEHKKGEHVCAIKTPGPSSSLFAIGTNCDRVELWDLRQCDLLQIKHPIYSYSHKAAIKALAFHPKMPSLLASGGGRVDRKVILFDTMKLEKKQEVDLKFQITSLSWDSRGEHLFATAGFSTLEDDAEDDIQKEKEKKAVTLLTFKNSTLKVKESIMNLHEGRTLSPNRIVEDHYVTVSFDDEIKIWDVNLSKKPKERTLLRSPMIR